MTKTTNAVNMSFRVDRELKKQADELFKALGMNTSVALNMFLTQCVKEQSLLFTPTNGTPNARLLAAIEEVEAIERGEIPAKRYKSFKEALEDIDFDEV